MGFNSTMNVIDGAKLEGLLNKYCEKNGVTFGNLAEELGFTRCFFKDCCRRNRINNVGVNFLDKKCSIKFEDYKLKEETSEVEESEVSEVLNSESEQFKDIIAKLDELINAVNKLGNIEMQQLDYLKDIKNKPAGYVKPIVK